MVTNYDYGMTTKKAWAAPPRCSRHDDMAGQGMPCDADTRCAPRPPCPDGPAPPRWPCPAPMPQSVFGSSSGVASGTLTKLLR